MRDHHLREHDVRVVVGRRDRGAGGWWGGGGPRPPAPPPPPPPPPPTPRAPAPRREPRSGCAA
ncbi:hypothetical protein FKR81_05175 [Lentzea tibetensis]|uniref:Uncharacterized protein n=1 Tax=Lentzea tibetensis TaxID=2591470 RepID=A0A563F067_9PSEU|nr:hypothetical protein FKR81_05175 [Lentzea tibetensis]